MSSLYGGSISDKEIVKSSSLIDLLEENDLIMADRGFDIQDLLACKKVKLFIPPKRQSKSEQFSKEDCFSTMRIANVRIHIEKAITRIKGWHIFDGVIPLSLCGGVSDHIEIMHYMASSFIQCVTKKGSWSTILLITLKYN